MIQFYEDLLHDIQSQIGWFENKNQNVVGLTIVMPNSIR